MVNEKEIIKKLLALAAKQQKIITKLAQDMSRFDPMNPNIERVPQLDRSDPWADKTPFANKDKTPAQHLPTPSSRYASPTGVIKAKLDPQWQNQIAMIQITRETPFKVKVTMSAPNKYSDALENAVAAAVNAIQSQNELSPVVPRGQFTVEESAQGL